MTREELDRLLAGYATGQLSDAERRQLMQAALDDQTVFDALAAEEPLRELLSDPAARREILDSLPPVKQPEAAWWRAPWAWALAGSLAAGAVIGVALWQGRPRNAVLVATERPLELPAQAPAAPPTVPRPAAAKPQPTERKRARVEEERTRADVKEAVPPPAFRAEPVPESKQRSNSASGVVGGVVGGVVAGGYPPQAAPPAPPPPAKPAEADAVAANAPAKDERVVALQMAAEGLSAKKAPDLPAFLQMPDGTRTRLAPGATVDRGSVVFLEVEGPVQIVKVSGGIVETVPAGVKRQVRLATDRPGEQRYSLMAPDAQAASPRAATFAAARQSADSAGKSSAGPLRKAPEFFFNVR